MNKLIEKIKLNPDEVIKKLKKDKFYELLNYLSNAYYNKQPLLSDQLFDLLKDEYENKYGDYKMVGATPDCDKIDKINLEFFMGSLKKPKPESSAFLNWVKKFSGPYIVSYKLDGMSGLLTCKNINDPYIVENGIKYSKSDIIKFDNNEKGILILISRGDGEVGVNLSRCIKYINIIKNLKIGETIRGELIISKKNFEKIASNYTDARTAITSLTRDTKHTDNLHLIDFKPYGVFYPLMKISEQYEFIKNLNPTMHYNVDKLDNDKLSKMLIDARENYEYEIDGLVIIDDSKIYKNATTKYPDHMIAFKQILMGQIAETTINHIEWNISKHNILIPKAIIEPVIISEREHKKAAAHNAKFIVDNCLGAGSIIEIIRSGDVIPKIHKIIKISDSGKPDLPNEKYVWDENKVNIMALKTDDMNDLNNIKILTKKITHTFEKLKITNMGESTILKFIENDYNTFWKILYAEPVELYDISGFGFKSINKLYEEIQKKLSKTTISQLAAASNCFDRGIGEKKLQLLFNEIPNFIDIYKNNKNKKDIETLILNIKGFDEKTVLKILNGMDEFIKWMKLFMKYKKDYNIIENITTPIKPVVDENNKEYYNKNICFSGIRDEELEQKLKSYGANIVSSVSKKTDILIVKDKMDTTSKITKAKELNIKIFNIDEIIF
jgi:NAD-dependent DNA ligase